MMINELFFGMSVFPKLHKDAAAELLKRHGATEVWAAVTHGLLSGPAIDRIKNSVFDKVIITDTIPMTSDRQCDKIEVLSVAPLLASAILAVFSDSSVSDIFGGENQS